VMTRVPSLYFSPVRQGVAEVLSSSTRRPMHGAHNDS
jgi:hypothetical protein